MAVERRTVIKGAAVAAGATALAGPFQGLVAGPAGAAPVGTIGGPAFRGLRAVPDERDGKVRLHLPEGFRYRSFHDTETPITLDDGTVLPGRHDGMGAFRGPDRGTVTLIRNHEVNNPGPAFGPPGAHVYDPMARGGCTHVDVDGRGNVKAAWTAISGTMMNCSGGQMPWGAWVTCEETVNGPDVGPDFTGASNVPLTKPHGYVFEVPTKGRAEARPITRAGRFPHEAVSFDPREGRLYLTEDNFAFPSGFYRYTPKRNPMRSGHLDNEGRLQMLAVKGQPNAHLEGNQRKGATYKVQWVDIDDPDPTYPYTPGQTAPTLNDTALQHVSGQGRAKGAAGFSRLEGQIYDNGVVYFTSTQGGGDPETGNELINGYGNGFGQVWAYDTRSETLRLVYQSPGKQTFDFPDNITVSDRGTLVVCEDSNEDNYVRGLSRGGQLWDIALNRAESARTGLPRYDDEFAGSTFSPDGRTLFVNIQASAGMSFAIWGPWERIGV
ncbi:alkaline phosphatase PhoX [Knoellia sp. LjRoot47]|uniref:alkaline phosphatase PhoX n=1 Tax=Knoellia sp. LjRoot47 TaxID=3342330 RepID=UPI003ECF03AF